MTPWLNDSDVRLYHGDAAAVLRELPEASADCCVTSPPYWGLRDYGVDGQIGLEETPDAFVAGLVAVFREVRRVLWDDGTLWLNLGDSYAGNGSGYRPGFVPGEGGDQSGARNRNGLPAPNGLKPKDLVGIPWRVAFALQADGWYLRSDIIWAKPNPMPESVTDRPTSAHEHVFLLAKQPRYWYDADAVREPDSGRPSGNGFVRAHRLSYAGRGQNDEWQPGTGRNLRNVWIIATQPTPEAHFATFPQALVERCLKAGCPEGGTVLDPFVGSGTTALVTRRMGRKAIGIDLSAEYLAIAAMRLQQLSLLAG